MMKYRTMILRLILILSFVQHIAGLLCYFCHDTSNEEGKNKCQTYYRTMRYYGKKANETGSFKTDKYVKNCSDYGAPDKPKYCMIASVEERKAVKSFIRDCSDGTTFFSSEIDAQFSEALIQPDNQTTCKYTGQGYLACVTICAGDNSIYGDQFGYGNFCNGPAIGSAPNLHVSFGLLMVALKIAFS